MYENALLIELQKRDCKVVQQMPIKVRYDSQIIGEYFAGLVVDDLIIVEIKIAEKLIPKHSHQLFVVHEFSRLVKNL